MEITTGMLLAAAYTVLDNETADMFLGGTLSTLNHIGLSKELRGALPASMLGYLAEASSGGNSQSAGFGSRLKLPAGYFDAFDQIAQALADNADLLARAAAARPFSSKVTRENLLQPA